jgi:hypothetical protein
MTYRLRHLWLLIVITIAATVSSWLIEFTPLIYMMPFVILYVVLVSLSCPRCKRSPFMRKFGRVRIGWPASGDKCWNCGFPFRDFDGGA